MYKAQENMAQFQGLGHKVGIKEKQRKFQCWNLLVKVRLGSEVSWFIIQLLVCRRSLGGSGYASKLGLGIFESVVVALRLKGAYNMNQSQLVKGSR